MRWFRAPRWFRAVLIAVALLAAGMTVARADMRTDLEEQYGLQIVTTDLQARVAPEVDRPDRPVRMIDLPAADEPAALAALRTALAVYPPGFVHRYLRRVAMAGGLTVFGEAAGGLFHGDMVAISFANVRDPASAAFDVDTLHHEFSSIVRASLTFNVTAWTAANPPGFNYMDQAQYQATLAAPGSVEGDPALHRAGFVALYGQTSLDNDWNTYAEMVFGHGRPFAAEIAQFPRMQQKTRQLIDIYTGLDPGFDAYFKQTGLAQAAP